MKVKVLQENLAAAVVEAGRVVPKKSYSLPQAQHLLLETVDGRLRVTGTDLETVISAYVGAQVQEPGQALIPAGLGGRMINQLPDEALTLTPPEKGHGLAISADGRNVNLVGMDPADYPPVPTVDQLAFTIDPVTLRNALVRVLDCVQTDEDRPTLTGVHFDDREITATDGFRLAVHDVDVDGAMPVCIVPAGTLRELVRLLKGETEPVQVYVDHVVNGSQMRFALKCHDVVTLLIQGTYPNYRELIPKDCNASVITDRKGLQDELRTAATLAALSNNIVRFTFGDDTLTLAAHAEEEGDYEATLPAKTTGEGKIAFNYASVADFLKVANTDHVEIRITSPSSPGLFLPVGDPDYRQVIMPMFVQWT